MEVKHADICDLVSNLEEYGLTSRPTLPYPLGEALPDADLV